VLALGQEADFYGSRLLIHKLPTIITAAITDATITITAAITDATITITAAAITDATITITAAAAARRRRRRRRNPDSTTAAAAAAPTGVVPTAATPATRTNVRRTIVALCFGVGGNGGSSECEGRREHGGYPAQLQQHDTSPSVFILGANPRLDWLSTNSDVKQGTSLAKLGESMHQIALISRYGESEDRRDLSVKDA
jgi:hypothetical protein